MLKVVEMAETLDTQAITIGATPRGAIVVITVAEVIEITRKPPCILFYLL